MRAVEFLCEDYQAEFDSALKNILVAAKAAGAKSIKTLALVDTMKKAGWPASVDSIVELLGNNPMILSADPGQIKFSQPATDQQNPAQGLSQDFDNLTASAGENKPEAGEPDQEESPPGASSMTGELPPPEKSEPNEQPEEPSRTTKMAIKAARKMK